MDPSKHVHYMPDGRRLTAERVAGFAFELAFVCLLKHGLVDILPSMWMTVDVEKCSPKRPEATPRTACFQVLAVHMQMILDAVNDIASRLQHAGYTMIKAVEKQQGHSAAHDLVLEVRKVGERVQGKYSGELKIRTAPANRAKMRGDCAGLFQAACRKSAKWLGQLVIVAEMDAAGRFLRSRAEVIMRGQSRENAVNLWGWGGRPAAAPAPVPPEPPQVAAPQAQAKAKAKAMVKAQARPAQSPKRAFTAVWNELQKFDVSWSNEKVVLFKEFFIAMGPRYSGKVKNTDRVIKDNRKQPLCWRKCVHYDQAQTRAEGRVNQQGGAVKPYIVTKTALKSFHDTL